MITLADIAAQAGEQRHGFGILDAFGDRDGAEAVREIDRRFDHFEVPLRIAHRYQESLVDLDLVGLDFGQIFEVRLAGAIIVDREAAADRKDALQGKSGSFSVAFGGDWINKNINR